MYYSLTNFYQNHRRYVKSRDDNQLLGERTSYSSLTADCEPFRGVANTTLPGGGVPYAPCGAIANSLFNGLFKSYCSLCWIGDVFAQDMFTWTYLHRYIWRNMYMQKNASRSCDFYGILKFTVTPTLFISEDSSFVL